MRSDRLQMRERQSHPEVLGQLDDGIDESISGLVHGPLALGLY